MSPRGSRDSRVTGQTRLRYKDVAAFGVEILAFGQQSAKLGSRPRTHMRRQRRWQRAGSVINQCLTYVTINTVG